MKIKFNSDDNLPLNKTIEIPIVTIVVRATFHENKYYSQIFLDECSYKLEKCCIMIELTFLKELMLIKQVHQMSVILSLLVFLKL